jgi:hypothetical protein
MQEGTRWEGANCALHDSSSPDGPLLPFVLPNCLWYPETAHSLHTQQVGILILLQQKRISYQVVLNDSTSVIPCALSQLVNDPCCGLQIAFAVLEFLWRSWERLVLVLEIGKFSGRHVH